MAGMSRNFSKSISKKVVFVGVLLCATYILVQGASVNGFGGDTGGTTGSGGATDHSSTSHVQGSGAGNGYNNCVNICTSYGGGWIHVDVNPDGSYYLDNKVGRPGTTINAPAGSCPTKKAYALVWYNMNDGSIMGGMDTAWLNGGHGTPARYRTEHSLTVPMSQVTQAYGVAQTKSSGVFSANALYAASGTDGTLNFFCDWEGEDDDPEPCTENCEPNTPPPPCGGPSSQPYAATTTSASGVKNITATGTGNQGWFEKPNGEFGGSAFTWAKPGDSVIFYHALTYCNQGIKDDHGFVQDEQNWFEIKATSINDKYAFGLNDSIFNRRVYLDKNTAVPSQISGKVDYTSNYTFRVNSPSIAPVGAGSTYSCAVSVYQLNPHAQPGYQTHGFTTATGPCNAASKTGVTNEAGKEITQTMEYNINRAYITHKTTWEPEMDCPGKSPAHKGDSFEDGNPVDHYFGRDNYYEAVGHAGVWGENTEHMCVFVDDTPYQWVKDYGDIPQPDGSTVYGVVGGHYEPFDITDWHHDTSIAYKYDGATHNDPGSQMNTVTVKIPFNFETSSTATLSNGISYVGESIGASFKWAILLRPNEVINAYPYATITPDYSQVQFIEFTLPPSDNRDVSGGISSSDPCGYYGAADCNVIETISGPFNPTGNYFGDSDGRSYTRSIPDTDAVGTKYCVAMGVYPNSSHLNPGQSDDEGMDGQTDNRWNIAGASCSTIAKKPNFQTWGAGLYTKGTVTTSVSKKEVNAGFGTYEPNAIFGSWSDFSIIALGEVRGMGSAAGFGYISALQPSVGGSNSGAKSSAKLCDVSNLTIAKTACAEGYVGKSKIRILSTIVNRFRARYTSDEAPDKASGYNVDKEAVDGDYYPLGSGVRYIKVKGNVNLAWGITGYNSSGAPIYGSKPIIMEGGTGRDTLVIHAHNDNGTATVNIKGNICYGDGTCTSNWVESNYIRGGNRSVDGSSAMLYSDVASLPQVLIFADNINIEQQVSQIDGWLIAKKTLNTCSNFVSGSTDADTCATTLTINGPVYAGDIAFNRTAGARGGSGVSEGAEVQYQNLANDGSITPAEIFNLRPDVYYWSYAQAQRYSQAVVTYTRELAPRY